jgi:hypothetical protein
VSGANKTAGVSGANKTAGVSGANETAGVSGANKTAGLGSPISLLRRLFPRLCPKLGETRSQKIFRRVRIGIVLAACLVTLQSVLMVMGAWRNDRQIERHMGVAAAEVLSAGPRRSTIEFVTPDEYDKNDPEVVRVRYRNASLAIIPAGSIAVVGWLIAAAALFGTVLLERRLNSRHQAPAREDALSSG